MYNIKSNKSDDGYRFYEVNIDNISYSLGNKQNYKNDIENLIDKLEGLLFDSLVIIFGIDSGLYLEELKKHICKSNKVLIIEPNENLYNINSKKLCSDNIKLIYYNEEAITEILTGIINYSNYNRIHVHCFGNYEQAYKKEYDKFIEILDNRYYAAISSNALDNRFCKIFFENMISNLQHINNSSPLDSYINYNKNIPAIVVSAGPSLDKNIQDMVLHKDKLENFFIIAGNRTMGTLIENGIKPNLVVSVDPAEINHIMMNKYLNTDVPLAFYEYSNKDLVREYKGEKVYLSQLFSLIIDDLKKLTRTYSGGSVAHTCIDIARLMGCNPIILAGQDCAYTFDKAHSDNATFDMDKKSVDRSFIYTKDIHQNKIKTTQTLNFFKRKIEEYIDNVQAEADTKFINVSYGADIKGAKHQELEEVLLLEKFIDKAKLLRPDNSMNIDFDSISNIIIKYINDYIEKCDEGVSICTKLLNREGKESFMDMEENDINLIEFLKVLDIVNEFENSVNSAYLGSYFTKFLFDVRQKYFEVPSVEYDKLTSNFKYQSKTFLNYFIELKNMLLEVKNVYLNISQSLD